MADQQLLANMYHAIQSGMVRVGRAPHYTELATKLGLSPGTGLFRERLAPDYLLRLPQFLPEWMATLAKLGKTGAFWRLGGG